MAAKAITHRVGGRTYEFNGANAALWRIATERHPLFQDDDVTKLAEAFGATDDNERSSASKFLLTKLWTRHPVLGPYPFLECLSEFEFERKFYHAYRDHVCHQLKVYLLGHGIMTSCNRVGDRVAEVVGERERDLVWLVTAVFHDIGYVVENEHIDPSSATWNRVRTSYADAMKSPLTPLLEKLGLSVSHEKAVQVRHGIRTPTLEGMGDLTKRVYFASFAEAGEKALLGPQRDADGSSAVERYFTYAQTVTSKRPPFKDHGVASALILTKTWHDLDAYLSRFSEACKNTDVPQDMTAVKNELTSMIEQRRDLEKRLRQAAGAMSLHNIVPADWNRDDAATHDLHFDTYKIAIDNNALAFLLGLSDTLQDWDRPTFSERARGNALHSSDIFVQPDADSGRVLVYVDRDAKEFRKPESAKNSRYRQVVDCLKGYLNARDIDSLVAWYDPFSRPSRRPRRYSGTVPLPPLHDRNNDLLDGDAIDFNAIVNAPTSDPWRWTVVLGKDEASRHGELLTALKRSEGRYIDSGFAYWGIGPTIQWRRACVDTFYKVMRDGIATFPARWDQIVKQAGIKLPDLYVSFGVGTGEKDNAILMRLAKDGTRPIYIPIDMSLDMLMNGARQGAMNVVSPARMVPLQIDFSSTEELATLKDIRQRVFAKRPALFSVLGNTLANFEDDEAILRLLVDLLEDQDYLLLELAETSVANAAAAHHASNEYEVIPSLMNFVRSALTQHTDLPVEEIRYEGSVTGTSDAVLIDMSFESKNGCEGRLIDGSKLKLKPGEQIRLLRSRKYTYRGVTRLLQATGLRERARLSKPSKPYAGKESFGMYLGLCSKAG